MEPVSQMDTTTVAGGSGSEQSTKQTKRVRSQLQRAQTLPTNNVTPEMGDLLTTYEQVDKDR